MPSEAKDPSATHPDAMRRRRFGSHSRLQQSLHGDSIVRPKAVYTAHCVWLQYTNHRTSPERESGGIHPPQASTVTYLLPGATAFGLQTRQRLVQPQIQTVSHTDKRAHAPTRCGRRRILRSRPSSPLACGFATLGDPNQSSWARNQVVHLIRIWVGKNPDGNDPV